MPTAAVPSAFKWKSFRSFNAGNKSIIYVSAYCNIYFFISREQNENLLPMNRKFQRILFISDFFRVHLHLLLCRWFPAWRHRGEMVFCDYKAFLIKIEHNIHNQSSIEIKIYTRQNKLAYMIRNLEERWNCYAKLIEVWWIEMSNVWYFSFIFRSFLVKIKEFCNDNVMSDD